MRFQGAGGKLAEIQFDGSLLNIQNGVGGAIDKIALNGNVGIGTASPQAMLHVASTAPVIRLQNTSYEDTDGAFYGWLGGYDKSGDEIWWLGEGSSTGKSIGFHTNRDGYNLTLFNKGQGITIDGSGNVGIGTANPTEKLHVNGVLRAEELQVNSGFQLGGDAAYENVKFQAGTTLSGYNGALEILPVTMPGMGIARQATYFKSATHSTGGTQHDVIVDGSIGVGTANPLAKLHVQSNSGPFMRLSINSSNYLYSGIDSSGLYFEQVASSAAKSRMRLQTRNANQGAYTQFIIDGANQSFHFLNGNFGIGTDNPSNEQGWSRVLDVRGGASTKILATNSDATYKTGLFTDVSWHGGGGFVGTESNHTLHLLAGYVPRVSILTNGHVGIGTSNPSNVQNWSRVLDVRGGASTKILATNSDATYKTGLFTDVSWHGGGGFVGTESNHTLHLLAGYVPRVSILTDGNIGIGTNSPSNTQGHDRVLDVRGTSNTKILATNSDATYKTGLFTSTTLYGGGGFVGTESNHALHLLAGYSPRVSIFTDGNVGIGTTAPSNEQGWNRVLDVRGANHTKILATNSDASYKTGLFTHVSWHGGGGFVGTESNHNLHLLTGYIPRLSILTNGNVGIGTTNPQAMLAVNGPVHGERDQGYDFRME